MRAIGIVFSGLLWVACGGSAPPPRDGADADSRLGGARDTPRASSQVSEAEKKIAAGDAAGARPLLEAAIRNDPGDARAHLDLGIVCEMEGDAACAESSYRAAMDAQGDFVEAMSNLGVLLRDQGRLDDALPVLRRAAELGPDSAKTHMNLALALEDAGDGSGAAGAYERALSLEPDDAMTGANYGLLLLSLDRQDEAAQVLRRAMRAAKDNRPALLAIGNGLRRAGAYGLAVEAMRAAVATGGDPTPALLAELAQAERAAGDREAAVAALERALSLDDGFATAHYLLGGLHAGAGRFKPAKKHYQRYLKLAPDGPQADKARAHLAKLAELAK